MLSTVYLQLQISYRSIIRSLAPFNLCLSKSRSRSVAFISSSRAETLAHASSRADCYQQQEKTQLKIRIVSLRCLKRNLCSACNQNHIWRIQHNVKSFKSNIQMSHWSGLERKKVNCKSLKNPASIHTHAILFFIERLKEKLHIWEVNSPFFFFFFG